jgi:hypothetical protein
MEAIKHDKKAVAGRPRFVLATAIGNVEYGIDVPETAIIHGLRAHLDRGISH